ncbi:MAG: hypothetical protein GXY68_03705 [Chloroflexi bacterium]|nr:hypothetical protein [Chloroflexota bacterium]
MEGALLTEDLAIAPEFALPDSEGRMARLSDYAGRQHVVLVFNRGFA